ncbi:S-layer homology domain-containing protein, partial [Patescibacteria group bacterium]|nr:S-layer homology domain-containing protein [Patescibacteria group bacterium]
MRPNTQVLTKVLRKTTIVLFDLLVISALVFLAVLSAKALDNSGLKVTVTTNSETFSYGENIEITLEAENLTGDDIELNFDNGCQMGFDISQYVPIYEAYSLPIYNNDLYPRNCDTAETSLTIANGKKAIWTRTMKVNDDDFPKLIPGEYILHAFIIGYADDMLHYDSLSYVNFTVAYAEDSAEGGFCDLNETINCDYGLECAYDGIFTNEGGICLSDSANYNVNGIAELICEATGGRYSDDCECPVDTSWSHIVGCTEELGVAQLCIATGGVPTDDANNPCYCLAGSAWDGVRGCTDEANSGLNDIAGHWGEEYIMALYNDGVVSGYDDGGFHPNSPINRVEMVKMTLSAAKIPADTPTVDSNFLFNDVSGWQIDWVNSAWKKGIVKGYSETIFAPGQNVTRAEAL